jgi:GNAT superfamily N-acetyltransferase
MEYIRRKRLYHAAAELYTGRRLFDIALDYGYQTPAGFYKAFKRTFGCAPSEYKNNNRKEGKDMYIDNVKTVAQLDEALSIWPAIYPGLPIDHEGSRDVWVDRWTSDATLLLYAKDNGKICGFALASGPKGQYVCVHADGVSPEYKNKGIHEALLVELEKRAKQGSYFGLVLGITEGAEEFYARLGYTGKTLIQSSKYSIDDLLAFNIQHENYEVSHTRVHDGHINQLWLNVPLMDKNLKKRYTDEIGDCWVQIIVNKKL